MTCYHSKVWQFHSEATRELGSCAGVLYPFESAVTGLMIQRNRLGMLIVSVRNRDSDERPMVW